MRTDTVFTGTGSTQKICTVSRPNRESNNYLASIFCYGAFGAGTLALFASLDGGTTLIPITGAPAGTAYSFTANGMAQVSFGHVNRNTDLPITLYATLSGATAANMKVSVVDNVG